MMLDYFHFDELDKLLALVTACGGGKATVAGGAVRDSVLEKPIKDIDIFYEGELDEEAVEKFFGKSKEKKYVREEGPLPKPTGPKFGDDFSYTPEWAAWHAQEWEKDELEINQYNDSDFEVSTYRGDSFNIDGKKIQLIKVEEVDKTIAEFPCMISRMLYSVGHLVIPKEAIKDVCLGIISFTDDCPESYKKRIMEKYNDYA